MIIKTKFIKNGIIPPMIREARILSFGNIKVAITHVTGAISKIRIYAKCN